MKTILPCLVCLVLLGACGLKGPLYLPEEKPAAGQTADKDAAQDKDKEKKKHDDGGPPAARP